MVKAAPLGTLDPGYMAGFAEGTRGHAAWMTRGGIHAYRFSRTKSASPPGASWYLRRSAERQLVDEDLLVHEASLVGPAIRRALQHVDDGQVHPASELFKLVTVCHARPVTVGVDQ